jgi:hypothetical protein
MHSYLVTVVLSGTHVDWSIPGANDIAASLFGLKGSTVRKYRKQDYNYMAIRKRGTRKAQISLCTGFSLTRSPSGWIG